MTLYREPRPRREPKPKREPLATREVAGEAAITRLRVADRRATHIVIELDGEPWAELGSEVVLRHALETGRLLDDAARQTLLGDDAFVRVRRAAAILLQARPRAEAEMRRLLFQRRHSEAAVERVMAHLRERGDLDDARFARIYTAHRLRTRREGPRRVAQALRQLGVEDRFAAAALAEAGQEDPEGDERRAREFAEKRLRRLASEPDPAKRRRKLLQAMQRAGFDLDAAARVARSAMGEGHDGD